VIIARGAFAGVCRKAKLTPEQVNHARKLLDTSKEYAAVVKGFADADRLAGDTVRARFATPACGVSTTASVV